MRSECDDCTLVSHGTSEHFFLFGRDDQMHFTSILRLGSFHFYAGWLRESERAGGQARGFGRRRKLGIVDLFQSFPSLLLPRVFRSQTVPVACVCVLRRSPFFYGIPRAVVGENSMLIRFSGEDLLLRDRGVEVAVLCDSMKRHFIKQRPEVRRPFVDNA